MTTIDREERRPVDMAADIETKTTTMRWASDWLQRIDEMSLEKEGTASFIREVLFPVLCGRVKLIRDSAGRVVAFEGRDVNGDRVQIDATVERPVVRVGEPVSEPPKPGRPRDQASVTAAVRRLEATAKAEGISVDELMRRAKKGR